MKLPPYKPRRFIYGISLFLIYTRLEVPLNKSSHFRFFSLFQRIDATFNNKL